MNTKETILKHMALAFFATAYADAAEEAGKPLQGEIMNQLPRDVDTAAIHAADTLCKGIEEANHSDIVTLFDILCEYTNGDGDRPHTPEMFGHYAAMQAMGHGVGLTDAFGGNAEQFRIPYVEFGPYSLQKDYF